MSEDLSTEVSMPIARKYTASGKPPTVPKPLQTPEMKPADIRP